jgi:predicted aspartyl protease
MVEIRLALRDESFAIGPLRALLDTGADATIVHLRHLQPLNQEVADRKYVRSLWGEGRAVYTYVVDVEIAGLRLPDVEVVADEAGHEVIVGRNVLNRLRITLDGPAGVFEARG